MRKLSDKINNFLDDLKRSILKFILSAQGLPIVLSLIVLGFLFVVFRMKAVDQAYVIHDLKKEINKVSYLGKELKAKKAQLLSVKNLQKLAAKHNLNRPKQKQLIIIPDE